MSATSARPGMRKVVRISYADFNKNGFDTIVSDVGTQTASPYVPSIVKLDLPEAEEDFRTNVIDVSSVESSIDSEPKNEDATCPQFVPLSWSSFEEIFEGSYKGQQKPAITLPVPDGTVLDPHLIFPKQHDMKNSDKLLVRDYPKPSTIGKSNTVDAPEDLEQILRSLLDERPKISLPKGKRGRHGPHRKENQPTKSTAVIEWSPQDTDMLIHNVELQLPKPDNRSYSTQLLKVDWNKACFARHEPEECKAKFSDIITKVRRYRTFTDIVDDAKKWVEDLDLKKGEHPNVPKKPRSAFFRFITDKKVHLIQERPDLSKTEVNKMLAKEYKEMPLLMKQKYKDEYDQENEQYKVRLMEFKKKHPDWYPNVEASTSTKRGTKHAAGSEKPELACLFFVAAKMVTHSDQDLANKKKYENKYQTQWIKLADQKRDKITRKVAATVRKYADKKKLKHTARKKIVDAHQVNSDANKVNSGVLRTENAAK